MTTPKSWLGQTVNRDNAVEAAPITVLPRHDVGLLESMTKQELLDYARKHDIFINSRRKKQEIIEILARS